MSQSADRALYLLQTYIAQTATDAEKRELMDYMLEAEDSMELKACMLDVWEHSGEQPQASQVDWDDMFKRIINEDKVITMPVKTINRWRRRVAAAAILLFLLTGTYFIISRPDKGKEDNISQVIAFHDVKAPETNKATITLENGNIVSLDNALNGLLAAEGNVSIIKLSDGRLVYQPGKGSLVKKVSFNTLYNPKGSRVVDMTLSDGSRVWLNAGSSITYPVVFTSEERVVKIEGEAYFEVEHHTAWPFKVHKNEMTVTVLGTRFNISAYQEEPLLVTLLEGSVNVNKGTDRVVLKPGQQAAVESRITINDNVNTEAVMAWKQGYFELEGASVRKIMNQLSRWYDVPVVYEGPAPDRIFGGQLSHTSSLSDIIKVLQAGNLNIKFNGKEIIVAK